MDILKNKRQQLVKRQIERDKKSESILDVMHLENPYQRDLAFESAINVTLDDKPKKCAVCSGTGYIKSLFSSYECVGCFSTGYDLSDPIRLIKWQQLCMSWSKTKIRKLERDLQIATTTEAERMEKGISEFYNDIKNKNNYRGD